MKLFYPAVYISCTAYLPYFTCWYMLVIPLCVQPIRGIYKLETLYFRYTSIRFTYLQYRDGILKMDGRLHYFLSLCTIGAEYVYRQSSGAIMKKNIETEDEVELLKAESWVRKLTCHFIVFRFIVFV